jgi:hypothetical protein
MVQSTNRTVSLTNPIPDRLESKKRREVTGKKELTSRREKEKELKPLEPPGSIPRRT